MEVSTDSRLETTSSLLVTNDYRNEVHEIETFKNNSWYFGKTNNDKVYTGGKKP